MIGIWKLECRYYGNNIDNNDIDGDDNGNYMMIMILIMMIIERIWW